MIFIERGKNNKIQFSTYSLYMWFVLKLFFFVLLLSGCVSSKVKMSKNVTYCAVNQEDNLKDIKNIQLFNLEISKNSNIILPEMYSNYTIPIVDSFENEDRKIVKNPSICPPLVLKDMFSESVYN